MPTQPTTDCRDLHALLTSTLTAFVAKAVAVRSSQWSPTDATRTVTGLCPNCGERFAITVDAYGRTTD